LASSGFFATSTFFGAFIISRIAQQLRPLAAVPCGRFCFSSAAALHFFVHDMRASAFDKSTQHAGASTAGAAARQEPPGAAGAGAAAVHGQRQPS
jgi:hypothetical protein